MKRLIISAITAAGLLLAGCSTNTPETEESSDTSSSSVDAHEELAAELEDLPLVDRIEFFDEALATGRTGSAKKLPQ